jgi:dipeptidyl aminopeptidase/acylaminoacyl peptidase
LILQGELDERCPKTQSEELFVSLRRGANPPCEMVLYPGGSHMFTSTGKPAHRLDVVQRIVEWVERHASQA